MTTTTDIKLDEKIKQKVMEPKCWKVWSFLGSFAHVVGDDQEQASYHL